MDKLRPLDGTNPGGTQADVLDRADPPVEVTGVAHANHLIAEQGDSTKEVFNRLLCAEADGQAPDAEAGQSSGEVEAKRAHHCEPGKQHHHDLKHALSQQYQRSRTRAAPGDRAVAQPFHAAREHAQSEPPDPHDQHHPRRQVVVVTVQQGQAKETNENAMDHHSQHQPHGSGDFAPVRKLGLLAVPPPKHQGEHDQLNQHPCQPRRHRNGGDQREPQPHRHAEKLCPYENPGNVRFHLVGLQKLVELGNLGERFRREEPDLSGAWVAHTNKDDVGLAVIDRQRSQLLAVGRHSGLNAPFGICADRFQTADEGAVQHRFQFCGELLSLACAAGRAQLQVLGGGQVVLRLHRLQKAEQGSVRCLPAERVGGRRFLLAGLVGGLQDRADLSPSREAQSDAEDQERDWSAQRIHPTSLRAWLHGGGRTFRSVSRQGK